MGFREGPPYLDRPVGPKARVAPTVEAQRSGTPDGIGATPRGASPRAPQPTLDLDASVRLMTGRLEEPAAGSLAQARAVSPSPLEAVRGVVSGWRSRATWRTPALFARLGARLSQVEGRAPGLAVALLLA